MDLCFAIIRLVSDFWRTKFTIEPGVGMGSYSISHFLWLAIMIFLILLVGGHVYRRADMIKRKKVRWIVASLIMLDEIAKDVMTPITDQWDWSFLPLHLCSISVFIVFFHALTGSKYLEEYLYAITLPTAAMAMVFPDWTGELPAWNFMCLHSFTIHMLLVLYPCLLLCGGFKPDPRRLFRIIPIVLLAAIIMHFVNNLLGTNFFFVNGGGDGANPLSLLEGYVGWWYLLAMPVIAAICWVPMYITPNKHNITNK